jgi:20S proteasome alpha/beta subunit
MTVCVAAIAEGNTIFAAADRMLTAGDIEYEPATSKIVDVTNAISILWAGDAAIQAEILPAVAREIGDRITKNKDQWWMVSEVADLYRKHYMAAWRTRAEAHVLAPLNLDAASLVRSVKDMPDARWKYLVNELSNFDHFDVEAIVFGMDPNGAHLFAVSNVKVECCDNVGFAAIGAGRRHAESFLMFAKHTARRGVPETLFDVYAAKKFAEAAPFVGRKTDLWYSTPPLGGRKVGENVVADNVVRELEDAYLEARASEVESKRVGPEKFRKALDELVKKQITPPVNQAGTTDPAASLS